MGEPNGLVGIARWKSPMKNIDEALKALGFPISVEALAAKELGNSAIIHREGSFDVAVSIDPSSTDDDPNLFAAISIPVTSFEEARAVAAKKGKSTEIRPGVLRIVDDSKNVCDLALSLGDAPARIVCSSTSRDLDALRPWLTRGLPVKSPLGNDLGAEVRFNPLKERFLGKLRVEGGEAGRKMATELREKGITDPDLLRAPGQVIDEGLRFLDDADKLELRSVVGSSPPSLSFGGTLRFASNTSWITTQLTAAGAKAGPPPALFWQAPKDASSVTFGRGHDVKAYEGITRVVHKAVAEALARAPIDAADKRSIAAFVDGIPYANGDWVTARGSVRVPRAPAKDGKRTPAESVAAAKSVVTSYLGWMVSGVESPSAPYVAWAKQGVDVYDRMVRLARAKATSKADKASLQKAPRIAVVNAPGGYPKGTVAVDLVIPYDSELADVFAPVKKKPEPPTAGKPAPKPPVARGSMTLRLVIVPDGANRTWIGFSADDATLKKQVAAAFSGAPKEGTIAARTDLEPLRTGPHTSSGFFTMSTDTFEDTLSMLSDLDAEKTKQVAAVRAVLQSLPHKGQTPVLILGTGAAGGTPSLGLSVQLQKGTLEDLAALGVFAASPQGRELLKGLK